MVKLAVLSPTLDPGKTLITMTWESSSLLDIDIYTMAMAIRKIDNSLYKVRSLVVTPSSKILTSPEVVLAELEP